MPPVPPVATAAIRSDLLRVNADIRAVAAQAPPREVPPGTGRGHGARDQDLESLIHHRDRVVTKLDALRIASAPRRPRLCRELEAAWSELQQTWIRVRRRRLPASLAS